LAEQLLVEVDQLDDTVVGFLPLQTINCLKGSGEEEGRYRLEVLELLLLGGLVGDKEVP
jgi:hypothetical protein